MTNLIKTAVFPVGGLGTRFLPATKAMPKEMLTIVDKPLIQYAVEEAVQAGVEHIIFVTGKGKTALEDHFDRAFELEYTLNKKGRTIENQAIAQIVPAHVRISYTRQGEPKGLGHAVWCAQHLVGDEPFAVLLADDFIYAPQSVLSQMVEVYKETQSSVLAVMEVPWDQTSKYGIIQPKQADGRVIDMEAMVEKPPVGQAPSNKAIIGRYILNPSIFKMLERQHIGSGGEIQLTDAIAELLAYERCVAYAFEGLRFDCGSKIGFLKANLYQALKRPDLSEELYAYLNDLNLQ